MNSSVIKVNISVVAVWHTYRPEFRGWRSISWSVWKTICSNISALNKIGQACSSVLTFWAALFATGIFVGILPAAVLSFDVPFRCILILT